MYTSPVRDNRIPLVKPARRKFPISRYTYVVFLPDLQRCEERSYIFTQDIYKLYSSSGSYSFIYTLSKMYIFSGSYKPIRRIFNKIEKVCNLWNIRDMYNLKIFHYCNTLVRGLSHKRVSFTTSVICEKSAIFKKI